MEYILLLEERIGTSILGDINSLSVTSKLVQTASAP